MLHIFNQSCMSCSAPGVVEIGFAPKADNKENCTEQRLHSLSHDVLIRKFKDREDRNRYNAIKYCMNSKNIKQYRTFM